MSNDLIEPPVPKLPIGEPVVANRPDAAAFVHVWGLCPCCGERMSIVVRGTNDLLDAKSAHV